jgi:TolA-binding protein
VPAAARRARNPAMRWAIASSWLPAAALLLALPAESRGQSGGAPLARAVDLMKNHQYHDAIRILREDIQGKPEAQVARQMLMLGECYYLSRAYEEARPLLLAASRNLSDQREKILAEFRLACTHFRLKDYAGAAERIDGFLGKHPDDPHVGTLLLFKMLILGQQGAAAEDDLVKLHKRIRETRKHDSTTAMEADQILCDFYRRLGKDDKAQAVYGSIVANFGAVIADLRAKKQSVPAAFEKSHDNAALQLGVIALEQRQPSEAIKWLQNVRYDLELKARARLLLARIAFERKDYGAVVRELTGEGFLDTVPPGQVKSDMYLTLGLCEKAQGGAAAKVEELLKQVGPEAKGYLQAQLVLGDLYLEKGLPDYAVKAFRGCLADSQWAPHALNQLAAAAIQQANDEPAKAADHYHQAEAYLAKLFVQYPLSPEAKQAREKVTLLAGKGIEVRFAARGEDLIAGWEKVAKLKQGTVEAAQALLSIMRQHFSTTLDERRRVVQAPNYAACAAACDRLLDERVYHGQGFAADAWKALRGEVLLHRASCELASVAPPPPKTGEAVPVFLPKAGTEQAIAWFTEAKGLVDRKQPDLVKGIELGLMEAMFKSDKPELQEQAGKRFAEVEGEYGNEPRFQRLALGLAEWYAARGRYAEAARQYVGVAEHHKQQLDEETLKLYYNAGSLYTKAAYEQQQKPEDVSYCIYLYPKAAVEMRDDLLAGYPPFQREVGIKWPNGGENITARDALTELSRVAGLPLVWSTAGGPNTIATYLAEKKLTLRSGRITVGRALGMILDAEHHRVVEDIGLADGKPTLPKPAAAADDPEARAWQPLEIYDLRQTESRFKPLGQHYGSFQQVHAGRKAMLLEVLDRVEKLTKVRVVWAESIERKDREDRLGREYDAVPGVPASTDLTCAQVLGGVLAPLDLRWRIARRQRAADFYELAREAFHEAWTIDSRNSYGQRAMIGIALNYFNQREYGAMKAALLRYLKICDSPASRYYHEANFWVGWTLENERKYREAANYYTRAAAERLVLYRPEPGKPPLAREALKKSMSYDTQFALFEEVSGELKDMSLTQLARWVELSARVDTRLDSSAGHVEGKINRPAFHRLAVFQVLCETLEGLGLDCRVENVDPEAAEKAYYRLALSYRRDNQMDLALESCEHLLERYPESPRKRDVAKLKVEIYRGLRDYGMVLATLEELRRTAADEQEKRSLANELAAMYFDLADYARAAEAFRAALVTSKDPAEAAAIRASYARALFRAGDFAEARRQYAELAQQPGSPAASLVNSLMLFYLKLEAGEVEEREFPQDAMKLALAYEKLTAAQRENLGPSDLVRVTWIYYVLGLVDVKKGRTAAAIEKFKAAGESPDDLLAGEAGVRLAQLHMRGGQYDAAREALEYMMMSVRSSESSESLVRGTYLLGECLEKLDRSAKATERFQELVDRYAASPYAEMARKHPSYRPKAVPAPPAKTPEKKP